MLWEGRKNAGEHVGIQHQAQNGGRITPRFCKVGETESWGNIHLKALPKKPSSSPCTEAWPWWPKSFTFMCWGRVVLQK